jgi:hypothetical protein
MNPFGSSSGGLSALAKSMVGDIAGIKPAYGPRPYGNAPVQQMQHGRLIDPQAAQGDGMADATPAQIDGHAPAALGSGEYVIPADAVSGLGNGSTAAGAQVLDQMVGRTRQLRTGGIAQAPQINPNAVLPT